MRHQEAATGSRRRGLSVVVLVVAGLVAGCGGDGSAARGYVSGDGVIEQIAVADRQALAPVAGRLLDGGSYDSRDHTGEVVVYNVWGSWCVPCREEAPVLRRVWNESREHGAQFVGINVRDNDAAARAFERRYNITYPSITTADSGQALLAFAAHIPASAVPSTIIVDRNGRVAARVIGPTTYGTLRSLVHDVLAEDGQRDR